MWRRSLSPLIVNRTAAARPLAARRWLSALSADELAQLQEPREAMDYDVLLVGAGPASLAAAIRLKQLAADRGADLSVCVVEKGAEVGSHIVSGALRGLWLSEKGRGLIGADRDLPQATCLSRARWTS